MGNLGMPELILILALALLLFGPQKLPEIGRQVGKALGEFKRTSNELKRTIEDEMDRATKEPPPGEPPSPPAAGGASPPADKPPSSETASTRPS